MENNDNIEIDLQELAFIVLNAESNYNTLKEKTTADGLPLYVATASTLTALYRNSKEVVIDDLLLMFYAETIKAIINKDETYLSRLQNMFEKK